MTSIEHAVASVGAALLAYVAITLIVVFLHEFGHYWAGRLVGAPIQAFSVGFGPELFGWTSRIGVRWKLCAIPFGGYVKFAGDVDASGRPDVAVQAALPASARRLLLSGRPAWQRAFVLVSGPAANISTAIVFMTAFLMIYGMTDFRPVVGSVAAGSPAAVAGVMPGDVVLAAGGRRCYIFRDMRDAVQDAAGEPVPYVVRRGLSDVLQFLIRPNETVVRTPFGTERRFLVGIQASSDPADKVTKHFGLDAGVAAGTGEILRIGRSTAMAIANVVEGRIAFSTLSGPVKIAHVAGVVVESGGARGFLVLLALISVSVGLVNLVPIPFLDGGHLALIALERVMGRPLSLRAQDVLHRVSFACLGLLVIAITANDLLSVFGGG